MSGNPFRRQNQPQPPPAWYSGDETSTSRQQPPLEQPRKSSIVKRVRIQTPPPLSPDSVYEDDPIITRVSDENHEGSPPPDPDRIPPSPFPPAVARETPFGRSGSSEDEGFPSGETLDNTRLNSATGSASMINVEDIAPGVKNPFVRTLASMEAEQTGTKAPAAAGVPDARSGDDSASKRSTMDVDAFKRLLMTGTKDTVASEPSPASSSTIATNSSYFPSSSNSTDTSSLSRHSLKEPPNEAYLESTSSLESASSSDSDNISRTTPRPSSAQKAKPPPPKHRHGKVVGQARTPQVVSFSDFTPSESSTELARPLSKPVPPTPSRRTTAETGEPPAPSAAMSKETSATRSGGELSMEAPPPAAASTPDPELKRIRPPVPLARRTSQLNPTRQPLQRADSSASHSSQASASISTALPPPTAPISRSLSKAPPPPPTRRSTAKPTASSEPFPPTPDQADRSPNTASRSSSISSAHRTSIAPPPPPPRRRGSSKSSLDNVSVSGRAGPSSSSSAFAFPPSPGSPRASIDAARRPSTSSLERVTEDREVLDAKGGGGGASSDRGSVLADMDALQAEIDALRAQRKA